MAATAELRPWIITVGAAFLATALLAGCSDVPDAANPVEWYKNARDVVTGDDKKRAEAYESGDPDSKLVAERGTPPPGTDKPIPNLSTVPERPVTSDPEERKEIVEGLVADRQNARHYSGEMIPLQGPPVAPLRPIRPVEAPVNAPGETMGEATGKAVTEAKVKEAPKEPPVPEGAPPLPETPKLANDVSAALAAEPAVAKPKKAESAKSGPAKTKETPAEAKAAPKPDVAPPPAGEKMASEGGGDATEPTSSGPAPAPTSAKEQTVRTEDLTDVKTAAGSADQLRKEIDAATPPPEPEIADASSARAGDEEGSKLTGSPPAEALSAPPAPAGTDRPEQVAQAKTAPAENGAPQGAPAQGTPARGTVVISGEGTQTVTGITAPTGRAGPSPAVPVGTPPPLPEVAEPQVRDAAVSGTRALNQFDPARVRGSYQVASILFANGSSKLGQRDINILQEVYKQHKQVGGSIRIVGHASSRTRTLKIPQHEQVNVDISVARARAVARQLIRFGANPRDLYVGAVSDTDPLYREYMPSGEAGNRRAEIFIDY